MRAAPHRATRLSRRAMLGALAGGVAAVPLLESGCGPAYTEKNIVPLLGEAWRQQKSPKDALGEAARQANAWLDARPKS